MKGKFFAGLRTTSRCEGLHSKIGRCAIWISLFEFLLHFNQCLDFVRDNEVNTDLKSMYGFSCHANSLGSTRVVSCIGVR